MAAAALDWWYTVAMSDQVSTTRARFREALQAVHVLPEGQGWTVMQAGHEPETFSDREAALQAAKRSAALRHVGVLVHESGRATRTD
jgi:phytoene/squalene synthetase